MGAPIVSGDFAVRSSSAGESVRPRPITVHPAAATAVEARPRGQAPPAVVALRKVHAASPPPARAIETTPALRPPVSSAHGNSDGRVHRRYFPRPYRGERAHSLAAYSRYADLA